MLALEIIFWLLIAVVIYTYFGYGLIIYLLNALPFLKNRLLSKEKVEYFSSVEKSSSDLPKVSLIVSASGESKAIIKEKIANLINLNYPKNKFEIFFAIAFDRGAEKDETIEEVYNSFLPDDTYTGLHPVDEEVYARFMSFDNVLDNREIKFLGGMEKELNSLEVDQTKISVYAREMLDNFGINKSEEEKLNIHLTKDIKRKGKIFQLNRTVKKCTGDIVVFSDANSMFNSNSIMNIVRHFADDKVGCVAGEKRIKKNAVSTSGEGEGFYWKYESFLKKMDSDLWSVVGAAGEIFAVRRELLEEGIDEKAIIEDFVLSMKIAGKGYRVIYEPDAYAEEEPTTDVKSEYIRKRRITAGGFQAIVWLKDLLNPIKYGILSFQYISHRVLRWAVVPFLLPPIFILNVLLLQSDLLLYKAIYICQVLFYLFSLMGLVLEFFRIKVKVFNIPFYFSMMNFSAYAGLKRYLLGQQKVVWERANR